MATIQGREAMKELPTVDGLYMVTTSDGEAFCYRKVAVWVGDHWRTPNVGRVDGDNRIPEGNIVGWCGPLQPTTPAAESDSGECERLLCKGCGKELMAENCWMQDGCPCNTPRGVNDGNQQISDWRQEREQKASREIDRLRTELAAARAESSAADGLYNTLANINDTCRSRGFMSGPDGTGTESRVIAMAQEVDALRHRIAAAEAERDAAVGVLARLPHTADGVPVICDGMTLFCPKGHVNKLTHATHRVYCTTGECWNDGCQGDSGSGTGYSFDSCYATAKGGGA